MSLDTHHAQRELEPNLIPPRYPLLEEYFQKVLGHPTVAPTQDELLQFFAAKHPDPNNPRDIRYIPRVESMLHALRHIPTNSSEFLNRLNTSGFVASFDGNKIALIDQQLSPQVADAIILGNIELILSTAKDLNLEIILGMYSGDENVALIAPRSDTDSNPNNTSALETEFNNALLTKANEFYRQPFFNQAHQVVKARYPNENLGLRGHYTKANLVHIYTPTIYKDNAPATPTTHAKQAIGSIIDATSGLGLEPSTTTTSLFNYLHQSLTFDLTQIIPKSLELEGIFPDSLQVRKIALLQSDLEKALNTNPDSELYLIRFADVMMKHTNKTEGHTKGDHHMIATANIIRRLLDELGISKQDARLYQHHGSFLLSTSKENYEKIAAILSDPVNFNAKYVGLEDNRTPREGQDPKLRANPYIVATTKVLVNNKDLAPVIINESNLPELWQKVRELQLAQLNNETLVALYTSGLALSLITDLKTIFSHLFNQANLTMPSNNIDLTQYKSLKFAEIFSHYYHARPQNITHFFHTLLSTKRLTIENFRKLRLNLANRVTSR